MKKLLKIFIGVLVLVLALFFAKNLIARTIVSVAVKNMTGLPLRIQSMDVGFLKGSIKMRGLQLHNPPRFEQGVMVAIPELGLEYDAPALFKGKIHVKQLKIDVKELHAVRNRQGEMNLNAIKKPKPAEKKPSPLQIDLLELSVGRVIYTDYAGGGPPKVRSFDIDMHERYENIPRPGVLASLIVARALLHTTLSSLTEFQIPIADLKGSALSVVDRATQTLQETTKGLRDLLR